MLVSDDIHENSTPGASSYAVARGLIFVYLAIFAKRYCYILLIVQGLASYDCSGTNSFQNPRRCGELSQDIDIV